MPLTQSRASRIFNLDDEYRKSMYASAQVLSEVAAGLSIPTYLRNCAFNPFDWQCAVLSDASTRICIDGARQGGKSTIISAAACHMAKYKPKSLTLVIAPTKAQASEDILKIRHFIASDRSYPEFVKCNTEEIETVTGSRILVIVASDYGARGYSNPDLIIFDEASRIPDEVFEAVRPMITNNLKARIFEISTPNGKQGFFYRHFSDSHWSRYLVRAPFEPYETGNGTALQILDRESCIEQLRKNLPPSADYGRIKFFFSPRHYNEQEQQEALRGMHLRKYKQEYGCEFVDADDAVFSQDLIEQMFANPLDLIFDEPETIGNEERWARPDPAFAGEYMEGDR